MKGGYAVRNAFFALRDACPRAKLALCAACLAVYAALACLSGGHVWAIAWTAVCTALWLYLPGRFWLDALRMRGRLPGMDHALAVLYGAGFLAVTACFAIRLQILWLLRFAPPALGLVWLALALRRGARPHFAWMRAGTGATLLAGWGALCALYALTVSVKNAHPAAAGQIVPNQDVLWNIGNAASFALGFPPQDIRFSGVRLAYHYLTELLTGALSLAGGLSCWDLVTLYLGPPLLAALVLCVFSFGRYFYGGSEARGLALCALLFCFQCASMGAALLDGEGLFSNTNLMHLVTNVNSQATAVIFVSLFAALFIAVAQRGFAADWPMLATFLCSAVMMSFAKGPAAAIAICSFAVTMLFLLARRPKSLAKWTLCFAGCIGTFCAVYFVVFASGANNSVHLGYRTVEMSQVYAWLAPIRGINTAVWWACVVLAALATCFLMQPLQFALYLRGLWRDVRGLWGLPVQRLFANGVVAGGWLAYYLFWHPSYSQLYFALIAIFFMNVLAVDALARLRRGAFARFAAVCGAAGFLTFGVLLVNFTGSGLRQLGRNLDVIEKYPYASTATAGDEAAMEWLRANSAEDAVFATDRIHRMANVTDGISNLYTALSGRQAYMEGYTYAVTNMGVSEALLSEKQAVNAALFDAAADSAATAALCRENGVDYLVDSLQYPGGVAEGEELALVYENESVKIYRVRE